MVGLAFAGVAASADDQPNNLVLRLWGNDKVLLKTRITRAAEAVGDDGMLILDFTTPSMRQDHLEPGEDTLTVRIGDLLASLPPKVRAKVFYVNSTEPTIGRVTPRLVGPRLRRVKCSSMEAMSAIKWVTIPAIQLWELPHC